jgi:putative endonuclease
MSKARVRLGRRGEELAAHELIRQGYRIVDRNWRCDVGEIDIVAWRDDVWSFYEVRTRRGRTFGVPEESLTPEKQQRMVDSALSYLSDHDLVDVDVRVGFVAIEMDGSGRVRRLDVYESIT